MAAMTTLPDASASARCSCASRERNSAGVRPSASIASTITRRGCGLAFRVRGERIRHGGLQNEARAHDVVEGKPRAATCSRSSADMPPRGVAMMIAPASGRSPCRCGSAPSPRERGAPHGRWSGRHRGRRRVRVRAAAGRRGRERPPGGRTRSSRARPARRALLRARNSSGLWSDHTSACGLTTQRPGESKSVAVGVGPDSAATRRRGGAGRRA